VTKKTTHKKEKKQQIENESSLVVDER